mmetsp:Transcript_40620/g.126442  ORF Transcript_40620/g.126442 Transcript_40620/m.126442 type:complete len:221 (-) Transcript_40620:547-1209(-)
MHACMHACRQSAATELRRRAHGHHRRDSPHGRDGRRGRVLGVVVVGPRGVLLAAQRELHVLPQLGGAALGGREDQLDLALGRHGVADDRALREVEPEVVALPDTNVVRGVERDAVHGAKPRGRRCGLTDELEGPAVRPAHPPQHLEADRVLDELRAAVARVGAAAVPLPAGHHAVLGDGRADVGGRHVLPGVHQPAVVQALLVELVRPPHLPAQVRAVGL